MAIEGFSCGIGRKERHNLAFIAEEDEGMVVETVAVIIHVITVMQERSIPGTSYKLIPGLLHSIIVSLYYHCE